MKVEAIKLKDCYIVHDSVFADNRGYFFESFNQQTFEKLTGIDVSFVQDNQSKSSKGVLRGLHFQQHEHVQAKLVRVLKGKVLDVAVDIRPNSQTFGQHVAVELTAENHLQLFVPRGFAHGFIVLEDDTVFFYKCDNFYNKESEIGVIYNDATLNIDWQIPAEKQLVSDKDLVLSNFISHVSPLKSHI